MNQADLPRWATAFALPLLNLLSALLVAAGVIYLLGESPLESLGILLNAAVLILKDWATPCSTPPHLSSPDYRCRLRCRQVYSISAAKVRCIWAVGLTLVLLAFDASLPAWLLIPLAIAGSAIFGAAWAFLPGYLQAKRGSHVVVTTIMFNFIAASLMNYIIVSFLIPAGEQNTASRVFADSAWLPKLNGILPVLGETPLNISFIMALLALVIYGIAVWRTTWGYQLRATGLNQHAAHYAGISISKTIMIAMMISGALAGLASVNSVMGSTHYLGLNFPAGAGFIGIAVALMGRQHPIGILLSSILFGALIQGGFDLSLEKPNIPTETFIFIQGLIILFCGAMENLYAPALSALLKRKEK
jgi:simple sugar transport system permease protein